VAHPILTAIWHILKYNVPYRNLGPDYYDGFHREHTIKAYLKRLQALNWEPELPSVWLLPLRHDIIGCCKGGTTMLSNMKELQERILLVPNHVEEQTKIEQVFNELKSNLECGGARLRCLLDVEKKLREETAV